MSDEEEEVKCPPEGLPAYMGTFADLMALLMCFFVLLLAFSEMDVQKYKQVAGSMKNAFGVQNQVKAKDIPKGTSVIAQEFSPGKPTPTLITAVQQQTINTDRQTLDFSEGEGTDDGEEAQDSESEDTNQFSNSLVETSTDSKEPTESTEALALKVAQDMAEELESGQIEIVAQGKFLVFRIREQGSFRSGEADIQRGFKPVLAKIGSLLQGTQGRITVAGHTDNKPIKTRRFPSNWELSSARAAAVARELLGIKDLEEKRLRIVGHGANIPVKPNTNRENRAYNRRVEVIIVQGDEVVGSEIGISNENELPNSNEPPPDNP